MLAKVYLRLYEAYDREANRLSNEIKELEVSIDAIRSVTDYDGMPHGSNIGDPTGQKATKLADKKKEYAAALQEAKHQKEVIFEQINAIGGIEADVLVERYIHYWLTWEEIGDRIGYTSRHCKNLHGIALNLFRQKYKMD